jgi:hypothetical protein
MWRGRQYPIRDRVAVQSAVWWLCKEKDSSLAMLFMLARGELEGAASLLVLSVSATANSRQEPEIETELAACLRPTHELKSHYWCDEVTY